MTDVLGSDLLLLNRPGIPKTYKITVDDLPFSTGSAGIYVGPNPPYDKDDEDENNGDLWWDTETGVLYIYYIEFEEGNPDYSKQWVQAAAAYGPGTIGELQDVNMGTAPSDEQALVWDNDNNTWKPGIVATEYIDLAGITNPFTLVERVIGNLPEIDTDTMTTQAAANEWFLTAIADLEVRKLEGAAIGIHPEKGDVLINDTTGFIGTGTSADPIVLTTNNSTTSGGYEISADKIKFINQTPGSFVVFHDENHRSNGRRFDQDPGEIKADGTYETSLEYLDTPQTISDTSYVSSIKVGELYFKWQVDQTGVNLIVTSETVVEGDPKVYNTIHAIPSTVSGGSSLTSTVKWYVSDNDTDWSPAGYEGTTYTIRESDELKYLRAETITIDTSGAQVVSASNSIGPVNYSAISSNNPIITGSKLIGSTLSVIKGGANKGNVTITYQWKRDGSNILGENGLQYVLTSDDYDTDITVDETIDDGHQTPVTKGSNAINADYAPMLTNQFTLSGNTVIGAGITSDGGSVVAGGSGNYTYTHKWYRDSVEIPSETGSNYTITSDDLDKTIHSVKTATDDVTSETVDSTSSKIYIPKISDISQLDTLPTINN